METYSLSLAERKDMHMKSTPNVFIRISLAMLFCLGMLVTANPAAFAQRDRDRDRGGRERCQKEMQDRYKHQKHDCEDRKGRERHRCEQRADRARRECRDKCRH